MNKAEQARRLVDEARAKAEEAGGMDKLDAEGRKSVRKLLDDARALQEAHNAEPADTKGRDAFLAEHFGHGRGGKGIDPSASEWAATVENAGGFKALTGGVEVKEIIPAGDGSGEYFDPDLAKFGMPGSFVADVCDSKNISGTSNFAYLRQNLRESNAAIVAPGAAKPVSKFESERVEDSLGIIAHLSDPQHRYDLLDADYLGSFLEEEMVLGLKTATDASIVSAITGDAGVAAIAFATDHLTTIRKGKTALAQNHVKPSALVINPDDAETLDLSTDDNGRFYFASAPEQGDASPAWSVPVIQSVAVASGVGLMGDFNTVRVYNDGRVLLDSTESGLRNLDPAAIEDVEEMFETNMVRLRAETRKKAAIRKPFALVELDLAAA
jgi:hypothetical protein